MTICASVKVRDGLVLATDSMTQIQARDPVTGAVGVVKTYSNARKLFHVDELPIGVMSYGVGNFGKRSIQGFMREFNPSPDDSVKGVTEALFHFIKAPYDSEYGSLRPDQQPVLGFFVAGYSKGKVFADEW